MGWALWIGALTQGLAYGFLAWGVMISLRGLKFADITVDGSLTTGAAVAAALILSGQPAWLAVIAAFAAGGLAGSITGLLHTKFGINDLLSGILSMTALYSVNLHIMGRSNLALSSEGTLISQARGVLGDSGMSDLPALLLFAVLSGTAAWGLAWFLRSDLGLALRATGDNPQMISAQGVNTAKMRIFGLALANAFVGLSGALVAQYQGFADINMGLGSLVGGIASVIIGETLLGRRSAIWMVVSAVIGSILYRFLIALALQAGLNPIDLKLATAAFVFLALAVPYMKRRIARNHRRRTT